MKTQPKKCLLRRLARSEAKNVEDSLLRKQRRGTMALCGRPTATERSLGEEHKCELRFYVLSPTFRYCPGCIIYRRNVSAIRSIQAKKAKEILMEEFRATNVDVLARDKSHLVSMNSRLAQELRDAEALINGLQKEKNEWQVAINEWEVALQNESAKTQALTLQIGECQHQISALTFKLGREASDHQASKLQMAPSHMMYHDQVGFQQHPQAYQSEGVYYQQPYQQSPQKET